MTQKRLFFITFVLDMDEYKTISGLAETKTVIKKSTFYAFAMPVETEAEVESLLKDYRKRFYDARHVCYAYMLGHDHSISKSSDNGEPSGTAGRPILGAIMSSGLTNILIVVVRYFGGVLLGTPGLIAAYKEGASSVIKAAETVTRTQEDTAVITFDYMAMNQVMKALKQQGVKVIDNKTDMQCTLTIQAPKSVLESTLRNLLRSVELKIENYNLEENTGATHGTCCV